MQLYVWARPVGGRISPQSGSRLTLWMPIFLIMRVISRWMYRLWKGAGGLLLYAAGKGNGCGNGG